MTYCNAGYKPIFRGIFSDLDHKCSTMVPNAGKPCIRLSISELRTLACSAIMLLLKPARDIPTDCQLFTIINFCLNDTFIIKRLHCNSTTSIYKDG